jgi:hypothetical protein
MPDHSAPRRDQRLPRRVRRRAAQPVAGQRPRRGNPRHPRSPDPLGAARRDHHCPKRNPYRNAVLLAGATRLESSRLICAVFGSRAICKAGARSLLNAPARGIEPRTADPKSAVLPLHHAGMVLSGNAEQLAPPLNKQHALPLLWEVAAGGHCLNIQGEPTAWPAPRIAPRSDGEENSHRPGQSSSRSAAAYPAAHRGRRTRAEPGRDAARVVRCGWPGGR